MSKQEIYHKLIEFYKTTPKIIQILLQYDLLDDFKIFLDENNNSLLHLIVIDNDYTCLVCLINYFKKHKLLNQIINLQNKDGDTAMHIAVRNNNFDICRILESAGSDLNISNNNGETISMTETSENSVKSSKLDNKITKINNLNNLNNNENNEDSENLSDTNDTFDKLLLKHFADNDSISLSASNNDIYNTILKHNNKKLETSKTNNNGVYNTILTHTKKLKTPKSNNNSLPLSDTSNDILYNNTTLIHNNNLPLSDTSNDIIHNNTILTKNKKAEMFKSNNNINYISFHDNHDENKQIKLSETSDDNNIHHKPLTYDNTNLELFAHNNNDKHDIMHFIFGGNKSSSDSESSSSFKVYLNDDNQLGGGRNTKRSKSPNNNTSNYKPKTQQEIKEIDTLHKNTATIIKDNLKCSDEEAKILKKAFFKETRDLEANKEKSLLQISQNMYDRIMNPTIIKTLQKSKNDILKITRQQRQQDKKKEK